MVDRYDLGPVRQQMVDEMVERIVRDPERVRSLLRSLTRPAAMTRVPHVRVITRTELQRLPEWLDVKSFALELGDGLVPVTPKSVADACRAGALRSAKAPGQWRIDPMELNTLRTELERALAAVGYSVKSAYLFPYDPATGFRIFDARLDRAVAISVRLRHGG